MCTLLILTLVPLARGWKFELGGAEEEGEKSVNDVGQEEVGSQHYQEFVAELQGEGERGKSY